MRLLAALMLASALALLVACGNERAEVSGSQAEPGDPVRRVAFPGYGIELEVPKTAGLQPTKRPGVFRLLLAESLASAFAYPRKEQIPRKPKALRAARRRLIKEVERRDPGYELRRSGITEVAGAKAIELVGDQTISRGRLRTRSVHVYKGKAEYVLELLAPVAQFERTNRSFFGPMLRSLKLSGKVKEPPKKKKGRRD